jgi:hypothetical protein
MARKSSTAATKKANSKAATTRNPKAPKAATKKAATKKAATKKADEKNKEEPKATTVAKPRDKFNSVGGSHFSFVNAELSTKEWKTMKDIVSAAREKAEKQGVTLPYKTYYDHLNRQVAAQRVERSDDGPKRLYRSKV